MKKKKQKPLTTAEEFAEAIRLEKLDFDSGLLKYLGKFFPERLDLSFFWTLKLAIGWAAMGQWEQELELSEAEKMTIRQIINEFGLEPFVEPQLTEESQV